MLTGLRILFLMSLVKKTKQTETPAFPPLIRNITYRLSAFHFINRICQRGQSVLKNSLTLFNYFPAVIFFYRMKLQITHATQRNPIGLVFIRKRS